MLICRVSTRKQQESRNLERQKDRLLQYCNEKQYRVIEVFEETGSGINDNRRELTKMFRRLKEVKLIIVELVVPILDKLSNLVVGGGIWMNTQRPEWNDANNAIVGNGLSIVTVYQLRRHLILQTLLEGDNKQLIIKDADGIVRVIETVTQLKFFLSALENLKENEKFLLSLE